MAQGRLVTEELRAEVEKLRLELAEEEGSKDRNRRPFTEGDLMLVVCEIEVKDFVPDMDEKL